MSIKTRFRLVLSIVLGLHLFTAVMGHVGLAKSQRNFQNYDQINTGTIAVLALDRTISELQRNVMVFMLSGNDASAERVRELLDEARSLVGRTIGTTEHGTIERQLAEMASLIETYGEQFERVSVDRATRVRLVRDEMFPRRDQILLALERAGSDDPAIAPRAMQAREDMLLGEASALRYFDSPSRVAVREAVSHLRRATEGSAGLNAAGTEIDIPAAIEGYERAFLDSVQATRGYLHLVNVVLAGQASELLHHSAAIRAQSLSDRASLGATTRVKARRVQLLTDLISALTVLTGILMASFVTRSLLQPILRITETLRQLAKGDSSARVEDQQRSGEIGAMAKAADVFRIKTIQTEDLLQESQRMAIDLERRNNEMSQFVYTVSHDLKSPLVTIQSYAEMLETSGDLTEQNCNALRRITSASTRMYETLNDLLELSRIGVVPSEFTAVDLERVCKSVTADLASHIDPDATTILMELNARKVWSDEVRVRQVIQNLVQNALKYGRPEHGGQVITIGSSFEDGALVVRVSDNGPGINPEYADKIFEVFQRLSSASEQPGTGVGLAIVKKIAEAHDGRAWLEHGNRTGATFCVSFGSQAEALV